MGNKYKDKEQDLSQERATTLDKLVVEAVARETAQITVTFTAILNERTAVSLPETLKVTSEQLDSRL